MSRFEVHNSQIGNTLKHRRLWMREACRII